MERIDHSLHAVPGPPGRNETIRPLANPLRRLLGHCGAKQPWRLHRSRIEACVLDRDAPVMRNGLSIPECADDVDTLPQPRIALRLGRPAVSGDVLVERLPA